MSLYTIMVSVLMALSTPLNIWMVVRCLCMTEHRVKHVLLASFAAGNLLHSTLGQGLQIAASEGSSETLACSWAQFLTWFTAVGSMVHFAFLSLERYLESTNSSLLDTFLRKCFLFPLISWAFSAFWCCLPLLGLGNYSKFGIFYSGCTLVSTEDWRTGDFVHFVLMIVVGVILPLVLAVVYHMLSYRTQNLCNLTSIMSLAYGGKKFFQRQKKRQQLNLVCAIIITLYFVLWVPYLSCVIYFVVTEREIILFQLAAPLIRELCVFLPPLVYLCWYLNYHTFLPQWINKKLEGWKTSSELDNVSHSSNLLAERNDEVIYV